MRVIFPVILGALVAAPALADAAPYRGKLFAAASYVSPLSESEQDFGGVVDSLETTEDLGYEFGMAGRWSQLLGFELSYVNATQDVEFAGGTIGEVDFEPIAFTVEFHLVPSPYVDFWIGPTVAWVRWDDIQLEDGTEIETDAETAVGATVGLEIALGRRLAVTSAVRYLDASAELEGFEDLEVDPLFARLGLAIRF
jgi:hypothetical protein